MGRVRRLLIGPDSYTDAIASIFNLTQQPHKNTLLLSSTPQSTLSSASETNFSSNHQLRAPTPSTPPHAIVPPTGRIPTGAHPARRTQRSLPGPHPTSFQSVRRTLVVPCIYFTIITSLPRQHHRSASLCVLLIQLICSCSYLYVPSSPTMRIYEISQYKRPKSNDKRHPLTMNKKQTTSCALPKNVRVPRPATD